jgi:hypothetical protein
MSSGGGEQGKRMLAVAVRFAGLVVAVAMVVLVLGLVWVNGCKSGTGDEALAHCGVVQRNVLGIGSPLILLLGGLGAFVRTYQVWRAGGRWWIWRRLVPAGADAGGAHDDGASGAALAAAAVSRHNHPGI